VIKTSGSGDLLLTSNQQSFLNRINANLFSTSDQLECALCHTNSDNNRAWGYRDPQSRPTSLVFDYDTVATTYNQHWIKVNGVFQKPTSCVACHENNRPSNHINLDSSTSVIVMGMNKGDCRGCHAMTMVNGKPAPVRSDWASKVMAFNHETTNPIACIDCHKNSVPVAQRATPTKASIHPVAKDNYNKIDCIQCHTFDSTLIPRNQSTPARSWGNIAFDHTTHLKRDGVTGPSSCLECHKNANSSLPDPTKNASHTMGARSSFDCNTCHTFSSAMKWYNFVPSFDHTLYLDKVGVADRCDTCHKVSIEIGTTISNPLSNIAKLSKRAVNPVLHVPVGLGSNGMSNDCSSCHKSTTNWKSPVLYTHSATDKCTSCHSMANPSNIGLPSVTQLTSNHFPIGSMECSLCHTSANTNAFTTFKGSVFDHKNTGGQKCSTCHNNSMVASTVPTQLPSPIGTSHLILPTGVDCNACHISTTSFVGMNAPANVTYTHNLALDSNCNSCHSGVAGFAKGVNAKVGHMTVPKIIVNGIATANDVQCSTCHKDVDSTGASLIIRTAPDLKFTLVAT